MNDSATDDPFYIALPRQAVDPQPRILKSGPYVAILDHAGDILEEDASPKGLFQGDTRHLSRLELLLNGIRPLVLSSAYRQNDAILRVDLTNPDFCRKETLEIPRNSLHLRRYALLSGATCFSEVLVRNYDVKAHKAVITLRFGADFADMFEVRGLARPRRGMIRTQTKRDRLRYTYTAIDGVVSETVIELSPPPSRIDEASATFDLDLEPGSESKLKWTISCEAGRLAEGAARFSFENEVEKSSRKASASSAGVTRIECADRHFDEVVERGLSDLHLLLTETGYGPYPYAGIPWFSTIFGRDGIITALLAGWLDPKMSLGVLRYLAASQATATDEYSDSEPGKILHEVRDGEMARVGEVPFGRYYGTVDATPLFIALAGDYIRQTGDLTTLREIWPSLMAAMNWVDHFGDRDGDSFVEYLARGGRALANQGWKDSDDSVFHRDGRLATGPIALCEVQAYAHLAKLELAELARVLGEHDLAARLEGQASRLRERFDAAFWCEDLSTYAIALDGEKRACRVRTSNAGHALFGGIVQPHRCAGLLQSLFDEASYSGWGIRTVAATEARFNPMSYHNGSVWPHDNALIGQGLARYGFKLEVVRLLTGLYEAARHMERGRLPELFCGFERRPNAGPTSYPVACSPQAWASASLLGLLKAALGIRFDQRNRTLLMDRPYLPPFVHEMTFRGLRLGDAEIDISLRQEGGTVAAHVGRRTGSVDVVVIH